MRKLRDFLAQADSTITTLTDKENGSKSSISAKRSEKWPEVPNWSTWRDFSQDNVEDIIGWLLDEDFDLPGDVYETPEALLVAANEPSFEFEVIRHNNAIVNAAISVVSKSYPHLVTRCWASGHSSTIGSTQGKPDFSTIPLEPRITLEDSPDCICPGDTKFQDMKKKFPITAAKVNPTNKWASNYLRQVCHYARERQTRYFYLLLPEGVVIGRRAHSVEEDIVEPQIVKIPWSVPNGKLNANTALVFLFIIAAIDHDVHAKYTTLASEYKEKVLSLRHNSGAP